MTTIVAPMVFDLVLETMLLTVWERHVEVTDSARSNGHGEVIAHDSWLFPVTCRSRSRNLNTGRIRKNLKLELRGRHARVADGGSAAARKEGQSCDDGVPQHHEPEIPGREGDASDVLPGLGPEAGAGSRGRLLTAHSRHRTGVFIGGSTQKPAVSGPDLWHSIHLSRQSLAEKHRSGSSSHAGSDIFRLSVQWFLQAIPSGHDL
jgi:hypothetical protein